MHWIDPDSLKPLKARVTRFLFNPKGDADGVLLSSGLEAHFPPHLSRKVMKAVQTGDAVTLYGVKPRAAEMLTCVAIENARGVRIDDRGPPPKKTKQRATEKDATHSPQGSKRVHVEDTVERVLHGPKGEVRGVLLSNGSIVRFPPHALERVRLRLVQGATLVVVGDARTTFGTTVIEARSLGKSKASLRDLAAKPHD